MTSFVNLLKSSYVSIALLTTLLHLPAPPFVDAGLHLHVPKLAAAGLQSEDAT